MIIGLQAVSFRLVETPAASAAAAVTLGRATDPNAASKSADKATGKSFAAQLREAEESLAVKPGTAATPSRAGRQALFAKIKRRKPPPAPEPKKPPVRDLADFSAAGLVAAKELLDLTRKSDSPKK